MSDCGTFSLVDGTELSMALIGVSFSFPSLLPVFTTLFQSLDEQDCPAPRPHGRRWLKKQAISSVVPWLDDMQGPQRQQRLRGSAAAAVNERMEHAGNSRHTFVLGPTKANCAFVKPASGSGSGSGSGSSSSSRSGSNASCVIASPMGFVEEGQGLHTKMQVDV